MSLRWRNQRWIIPVGTRQPNLLPVPGCWTNWSRSTREKKVSFWSRIITFTQTLPEKEWQAAEISTAPNNCSILPQLKLNELISSKLDSSDVPLQGFYVLHFHYHHPADRESAETRKGGGRRGDSWYSLRCALVDICCSEGWRFLKAGAQQTAPPSYSRAVWWRRRRTTGGTARLWQWCQSGHILGDSRWNYPWLPNKRIKNNSHSPKYETSELEWF